MMIHHSVGNRTVEILIHSGSGQKGVRGGGDEGFQKDTTLSELDVVGRNKKK